MAVLCGMLTIQYSARSAPLSVRYVCHFHLDARLSHTAKLSFNVFNQTLLDFFSLFD